jgi:hypothetical protein
MELIITREGCKQSDDGEELGGGDDKIEEERAELGLTPNKVYGVALEFTGAPKTATVVLQTWEEWAVGESGRGVELRW